MEWGLWDGPDVNVTLTRSGELLFSKSLEVIAGISDRVVANIRERIAHATEQPQSGSVPVPELGLTAMWRAENDVSVVVPTVELLLLDPRNEGRAAKVALFHRYRTSNWSQNARRDRWPPP
jgi:hypothetical protein